MRIGSLFSGAGGLDMAVEAVFGAEVAWFAEIDKAASKVLAHRYPDVPNLGDITEINWANWKPMLEVDILCGGFPCQDVSAAGKRAGIKDGTRSGLWSVFAEAIDILRPPIVIIENVRGLLSAQAHRNVESEDPVVGDGERRPVLRAAGAVFGDLSDLGYDARWATVSAASVGAPHRRERVFILAFDGTVSHAGHDARRPEQGIEHEVETGRVGELSHRSASHAAITDSADSARHTIVGGSDAAVSSGADGRVGLLPTPCARDFKDATASPGAVARNTPSLGAVDYYLPTPSTHEKTGARSPESIARMDKPFSNLNDTAVNELLSTPQARDSKGAPKDDFNNNCLPRDIIECDQAWGKYETAVRRWEALTRPAPKPTEPGVSGLKRPRLNPAFSEWLMGWPEGWVTDPDIGISRNDQLRIVGNGVCPQQAAAALRYLV